MQIPDQAQDILKFVEAVVCVCWYDPDDPEWVKQVPAFTFEPDKSSKSVVLGLYCQHGNHRPELVAELEFKKRLLSAVCYDDEKLVEDFSQGLQLMDGLVQLVRRSARFAHTYCDQIHHKVVTVKRPRVSGIIIGPTAPIVGGNWKLRGVPIAKLTVDQGTSTLLSFKSLYKQQ